MKIYIQKYDITKAKVKKTIYVVHDIKYCPTLNEDLVCLAMT